MNSMRSAVSIYYGDSEGVYPTTLDTSAGYSFSKYLENIPPVKATHSGIGNGITESPSGTAVLHTTDESITSTAGTGWRYNASNGHLFVNSATTDSKGAAYSTYGY